MDIGIERGDRPQKFHFSGFVKTGIFILLVCFFVFVMVVLRVQTKYGNKIVQPVELKELSVGLVFGAGLKTATTPSDILEDRISTAIKLYQDGKVGKFIMSGDNQDLTHNEVQVMKDFAMAQGLPEEAILLDPAGTDTRASCENVKGVFGLNKVVLITQAYHLRRALYSCNELEIDAVGIAAQSRPYLHQLRYSLRELFASFNAWLESFAHPLS